MPLFNKPLLVVDLDRTFLKQDTALSDFLFLLNHFSIAGKIKLCICFFKYKRAYFKGLLARLKRLIHGLGPYKLNRDFHRFLLSNHGRRDMWLVTGANNLHAQAISSRYPYFSRVVASDNKTLITPAAKLAKLQQAGVVKFDYAGDRCGDMIIFKQSNMSYIVNPSFFLLVGCFFYRSLNITIFDVSFGLGWLALILAKTSKQIQYPAFP